MLYNGIMNTYQEQKKIRVAVIGGGASGLFLAKRLLERGIQVCVYERGERLGKKLSATGNGQGNVTNRAVRASEYFTVRGGERLVKNVITSYDENALFTEFAGLGVLLCYDERGRAYPASRQASVLTDALRLYVQEQQAEIRLATQVSNVQKRDGKFAIEVLSHGETREDYADYVVFCTGGKAQKNFGTDGSAYTSIQNLGHEITPLFPSLVQLKTDVTYTKTLKGIRVADAGVRATYTKHGEKKEVDLRGDVIFTEYGVSGDGIFRVSAFLTDCQDGMLYLDFLPDFTEEEIALALRAKRVRLPRLEPSEGLLGIVNNQVGRAVMKRSGNDLDKAMQLVKSFPLKITGSLGFDYAQVTKGGVPLHEVTERLQSRLVDGLYFAGETLDVDGQCGGFNLQWAFSSACVVAEDIAEREGQV